MKKVISLVLTLALLSILLVSCGGNAGVDTVEKCYEQSNPYKITVVSTQTFTIPLECTTTIVRGEVDGKAVAVETVKGTRLLSIEEGSGREILEATQEIDTTRWYQEGKGVSTNKGKTWDATAPSFVSERGGMALDLSDTSVMKNLKFENNKLSFTVAGADATKIFPKIDADGTAGDVSVIITTDGQRVNSVDVSWTVPATPLAQIGEISVKIVATYDYGYNAVVMQ